MTSRLRLDSNGKGIPKSNRELQVTEANSFGLENSPWNCYKDAQTKENPVSAKIRIRNKHWWEKLKVHISALIEQLDQVGPSGFGALGMTSRCDKTCNPKVGSIR